MTYDGMIAESIRVNGHNGDQIDGYLARPLGAGPFPGVVLIHHMPGWDEATKEMARKFAYHGYVCISPNLHYRVGPGSIDDVVAVEAYYSGKGVSISADCTDVDSTWESSNPNILAK